jgi:hypothetical protein
LRIGVIFAILGIVDFVESAKPVRAQGSQTQPLSLSQIQKLIQVQAPDAAVAAEIRRRGLNFAPSKETSESLRRAGGGPDTLQAIDELRPMLDEAKQAIPAVLTKIYKSLDQGNPQAARLLVSPQIGASADRLDSICRRRPPRARRANSQTPTAKSRS